VRVVANDSQGTKYAWEFYVYGVEGFCGGNVLCMLRCFVLTKRDRPESSGDVNLLEAILDSYTSGMQLQINDNEGGMWWTHLFPLVPKEGELRRNECTYYFVFSAETRNPNSGNVCKTLIISCEPDNFVDPEDDDEYYDDEDY